MSKELANANKAIKSGLWYTAANVLIRALAIVTTPIYTSMLTTADYGKANTFNSWIEIFNVFTCLCVVHAIGRAKLDFKDKFDEFLSALQGLSSSFGFVVLILACIFRGKLSAWMQYEVPLVVALFVYLCVAPSVEYMMQKCRFQYKYKKSIAISLLIASMQIGLSIGLMLLFKDQRYLGKIAGVMLPVFLLGIFFYIRFLVVGKVFYKKEYWLYALRIGVPMIPHVLATILLAQMDRIMIKDICTDAEAGLYSFGYSFASLLLIFTNAIGQAWLPWFNETVFSGNKEEIKQIQKKFVWLGCFLSFAFIVCAPEALMLLAFRAPIYWTAKYVVVPVVLGTLAQYFYTNYVNVEIYHKRTGLIAIASCIAAASNYGLNCLFIPKFGYTAAAYTTLVSYSLLLLIHFAMVRVVLREKLYDDKRMFLSLIVLSAVGFGYMRLYQDGMTYVIARYLSAVILAFVFAMIKRSDIILLANTVKNRWRER